MDYKSVIESRYNREAWEALLHDIFLSGANFRTTPIPVDAHSPLVSESLQLGTITLKDDNKIAVYEIKLSSSVDIVENRVGIRNLLFSDWKFKGCAGAFIFCYRDNESVLRFSYVSQTFAFGEDGKMAKEETDTKRFTYILGEGHRSRTAIGQFETLKTSSQTLKELTKAFSLDAVSDEFFKEYKKIYEDIVEYVTGKRYVQEGKKWVEKVIHAPNELLMGEFSWYEDPDKTVRDYVKRLMSRIVFLQFIQKKGWLGVPIDKEWGEGDKEFLQHLYEKYDNKDNFVDGILELLFDDINHKRENDIANFILGRDIKVPYLNGGLFERDSVDERTFRLPRKLMDKMMNFFSSYNFTIDENDPDDAEIGVDPEMLGRIFENLLEDNKDKGAFYTPKEIVQYMCQESLIAYLQKAKNESEAEDIRTFVSTYDASVLSDTLKRDVDTKLKNVKICDPAIGSGAFPMGLLKELFACRSAIEGLSEDNAAEIKKHIIQNNIYGVDIEKGAVEIARLRFWLAIVVDEKTPHALPNMDFKIMQGNSLVPTFGGKYINLNDKKRHINYQRISQNKVLLHKLQTEFYGSEANHKAELLIRIKYLILEIVKLQMDYEHRLEIQNAAQTIDLFNPVIKEKNIDEEKVQVINVSSELQDQLNDNNISVSERASIAIPFFDWKILFSEVFSSGTANDGFDIVIGNPPYIDSETMTLVMPQMRELYSTLYDTAKGNWDMFVIFVELGMKLASSSGVFSFIIPNKIIAAKYADKIRERLSQNTMIEIRDYSRVKVFAEAAVYPCTVVGQMGNERNESLLFTTMSSQKAIKFGFNISRSMFESCPYWDVYFQSPDVVEIVKRLLLHPKMDDYCQFDITGAATVTEAYLIKEYLMDKYESANTFKVINTGTIDPYKSLWGVEPMTYIKGRYQYPRVKLCDVEHMNKVRLQQSRANKIIVAGMSSRLEAVLDNGEIMAGKSTTILTSSNIDKLKVLLAFINSRTATWLTRILFNSLKMAGGYLNYGSREILSIPIPKMTQETEQRLRTLVDRIHERISLDSNANITQYVEEIDRIVYVCYGFSQQEIKLIETS